MAICHKHSFGDPMTSYNVDLRYYKDVLGGLIAPAMGAHVGFLTCQVVIKLWIAGRI